jgi:hypothetical protein
MRKGREVPEVLVSAVVVGLALAAVSVARLAVLEEVPEALAGRAGPCSVSVLLGAVDYCLIRDSGAVLRSCSSLLFSLMFHLQVTVFHQWRRMALPVLHLS